MRGARRRLGPGQEHAAQAASTPTTAPAPAASRVQPPGGEPVDVTDGRRRASWCALRRDTHRLREPVPARDPARAGARRRGRAARRGRGRRPRGIEAARDEARALAHAPAHPRAPVAPAAGHLLRRRAAAHQHRAQHDQARSRCCCSTSPPLRSTPPTPRTVIELIREAAARGAAIVGIFHDAEVRAAVATRRVNVADFRSQRHERAIVVHERAHGAARRGGATAAVLGRRTAASPRCDDGASRARGHRRPRKATTCCPGLVELHTDNFERHLMPRPKVQLGRVAGAAGARCRDRRRRHHDRVRCARASAKPTPRACAAAPGTRRSPRSTHCTAQDLLRADHHLHVRCELPAPNTIELFEPFHGHPRVSLDLADGPHAGPAPVGEHRAGAHLLHRQEGLERREVRRARSRMPRRCRRSTREPHRRHFVDYCRTHGIALASHDDTTVGARRAGACRRRRACPSSRPRWPRREAARERGLVDRDGRAQRRARRLAFGQRGGGRAGARRPAGHPVFRLRARQPAAAR